MESFLVKGQVQRRKKKNRDFDLLLWTVDKENKYYEKKGLIL